MTLTLAINCQLRNFLKKAIGIMNFAKPFLKFHRRNYDLISKFQVGVKSLLCQELSEPEINADLVYLKKIVGSNNCSAQFIKIISHYKKISFDINVFNRLQS